MTNFLKKTFSHPYTLISLVLLAGLLLWLAPIERALGSGIKVVYLHVSLIWAGMTGLVVLGLLGIIQVVRSSTRLQFWCQDLGWISLAFFLAGIGMSMVAAIVNWGGIFWQEPRTVAMLRVVALALTVQVLNSWAIPLRLKGGLHVGVAVFLIWSVRSTALVLHPRNPIGTSSSTMIQLSFVGLFILACFMMTWLLLRWRFNQSFKCFTLSFRK